MEKQTVYRIILISMAIIFGILVLLNSALSQTIYSGETVEIPLENEIVNCSVTNSTWDLEGLNLSFHDNIIAISTHPLYQSDNLTISCWVLKEKITEEIITPSGGSSRSRGSSCKYKENFDWNCSEWSECVEGIVCDANNLSNCIGDEHYTQSRTCKKYNNCHTTFGKPIEERSCLMPDDIGANPDLIEEPEPQEPKTFWSLWLYLLILGIFIFLLIIILILLERNKPKI